MRTTSRAANAKTAPQTYARSRLFDVSGRSEAFSCLKAGDDAGDAPENLTNLTPEKGKLTQVDAQKKGVSWTKLDYKKKGSDERVT